MKIALIIFGILTIISILGGDTFGTVLFGIFTLTFLISIYSDSKKMNIHSTKNNKIEFSLNGTGSYSSILNQLENHLYYIAKHTRYGGEIHVVVQVKKIDNTYCCVEGNFMAGSSFRGVDFMGGYVYDGDGQVCFETDIATGFTSPEDVKRELLLQFNWSDFPLYDTNILMLDYNDYKDTPLVSFSFTIKKNY